MPSKEQPAEPFLDADDIQGHILPGYGPSDIALLALSASSGDALRGVLRKVAPLLTSMRAALGLRSQRKLHRMALGAAPDDPLRVHVALTRRGLDTLGVTNRGVDAAFDAGMTGLSTGDPKRASKPDGSIEPAHPSNWKVGGPTHSFDLLVMAVCVSDVRQRTASLTSSLKAVSGIQVQYEEYGEDLPGSREHFGFADGISSPGVYGEFEAGGERLPVTTRYGVPSRNGIDFGRPGQPLLWPGRFILGAEKHAGDTQMLPDAIWRNGSFLVFRRLEQDVKAFYADTTDIAKGLSATNSGVDGDAVRAFIVGRRSNGQPLMRPGAGPDDPFAINYFQYREASPELVLGNGLHIPAAPRDVGGATCPFWAHVRKVNPRDGQNDLPIDSHNLQMLRRGVPFGPAYDHDDPTAPSNAASRGLLFLAYQSNIHEQFENLNSHWMNQFDVPAGGGHDLLVGLSLDATGQLTSRSADWPGSGQSISAKRNWVIPTGGAYLFAPSLSAIQSLLS